MPYKEFNPPVNPTGSLTLNCDNYQFFIHLLAAEQGVASLRKHFCPDVALGSTAI